MCQLFPRERFPYKKKKKLKKQDTLVNILLNPQDSSSHLQQRLTYPHHITHSVVNDMCKTISLHWSYRNPLMHKM